MNFLTKTIYPQISDPGTLPYCTGYSFSVVFRQRSGLRLKLQVSNENVSRKVGQEKPSDGAQLHGTSTISNAPLPNPETLRLSTCIGCFLSFRNYYFMCKIFAIPVKDPWIFYV